MKWRVASPRTRDPFAASKWALGASAAAVLLGLGTAARFISTLPPATRAAVAISVPKAAPVHPETIEAAQAALLGTWTYVGTELLDDDGTRDVAKFVFRADGSAEYYITPVAESDWGTAVVFRYRIEQAEENQRLIFYAIEETARYATRRMEFIIVQADGVRFRWDNREPRGGGTNWDVVLEHRDAFPFTSP